jgi:hypothetical protein
LLHDGPDYTVRDVEALCDNPDLERRGLRRNSTPRALRDPGLHEVVVAAGGSGYERPISPAPRAAIALRAGPRREVARRGAREATGEVLLFLLADLGPPGDLAAQISEAV